MLTKKDEIQVVFGEPQLEWQRLEEREGCRIRALSDLGGYRDPEKWPEIYEWMSDHMVALEKAFRPHINVLKI